MPLDFVKCPHCHETHLRGHLQLPCWQCWAAWGDPLDPLSAKNVCALTPADAAENFVAGLGSDVDGNSAEVIVADMKGGYPALFNVEIVMEPQFHATEEDRVEKCYDCGAQTSVPILVWVEDERECKPHCPSCVLALYDEEDTDG